MKYPNSRLLLFTKAPEPGKVKTRLAAFLGTDAAAELYESLLHDCLEMCVTADLCPVEICCSPSTGHDFFQQCRERYHTTLQQQAEGDIGQRMSRAIMSALQRAEHVVLIGADCPALTADDLDNAFYALQQGTDVVLGPAKDGGYYLIGMSSHHPGLFENIPWSTHRVLAATETLLREQCLSWHLLPLYRDVDTAEDYSVYMATN
ncbi:MAG TPA: glycosyltransferase [Gammaproteobacteria bacterium]|nr:glycosyltransferase [Gammaproteobacteria bacterium]